jgi:hypothetical protein
MTKTIFKTLSLSLALVSAAVSSLASQQSPRLHDEEAPALTMRARLSQSEIDRGWERQQSQIEAILSARAAEGRLVPGAIILPPLPGFASHESTESLAVNSRKASRPATIAARPATDH